MTASYGPKVFVKSTVLVRDTLTPFKDVSSLAFPLMAKVFLMTTSTGGYSTLTAGGLVSTEFPSPISQVIKDPDATSTKRMNPAKLALNFLIVYLP